MREMAANEAGKILVAGVACHHLVQGQQGESGNHHFPSPPRLSGRPVETLDQQHILAQRMGERHPGHIQPAQGRQPHGDIFRLDHGIQVAGRSELGDVFLATSIDGRLGPGAADGGAILQGFLENQVERHPLLDELGGLHELVQGGPARLAWHITGARPLEIQGAGPVRSGFQQVGQLVQSRRIRRVSLQAQLPVENDAPSPCVWRRVADAARHVQTWCRRNAARLQRHLHRENGYGIFPR